MTDLKWTKTPAGAYEAQTEDAQTLLAFKSTGRRWLAQRDGLTVGEYPTLRDAKAALIEAAAEASRIDEAAEKGDKVAMIDTGRTSEKIARARRALYASTNTVNEEPAAPAPLSRQQRRANDRAAGKRLRVEAKSLAMVGKRKGGAASIRGVR